MLPNEASASPDIYIYQRVRKHLPSIVSLDLLILKGHLLIEEQMDALIAACSRDPKPLKKAGLRFFQKICIAEALSNLPSSHWRMIQSLNKLRNDLSHNLDTADVDARVDDIVRQQWEEEFKTPKSKRQRASNLRSVLIYTIAMMAGFAEGHRETKRRNPSGHGPEPAV
jgi:hypothetical protein